MKLLQEKLDFLLQKYAVPQKAEFSADGASVRIGTQTVPLLPHRNERRIIELKKITESTVGMLSHFKIMSLNPKNVPLEAVIRRELDTAEFISGQQITEIFAVMDEAVCTLLCLTSSRAVITLELACTLPEGSQVVDKHEIITDRGTACDRAVDSQTPLSSVYVYGENREEYTDVDFELYGLSIAEIAAVRQAFAAAEDPALAELLTEASRRVDILTQAAAQSAKLCANVIV